MTLTTYEVLGSVLSTRNPAVNKDDVNPDINNHTGKHVITIVIKTATKQVRVLSKTTSTLFGEGQEEMVRPHSEQVSLRTRVGPGPHEARTTWISPCAGPWLPAHCRAPSICTHTCRPTHAALQTRHKSRPYGPQERASVCRGACRAGLSTVAGSREWLSSSCWFTASPNWGGDENAESMPIPKTHYDKKNIKYLRNFYIHDTLK